MNKFKTVDVAELSAVVGGKRNPYSEWKCAAGTAVSGLVSGVLGGGNPVSVAGGIFTGYAKYCA